MTNLLIALKNFVENPLTDLVSYYQGTNRANSMGDALETYVKDLFCNSTGITDLNTRNTQYERVFSYIGNQNNPPDIMIRGGDAIEVKKIESLRSDIALNSSYPKDKLYADSPMITQSCRDAENWQEKDIMYVVGVAKENKLKTIWFVYGDCFAAKKEVYERIRTRISSGLRELEDVAFSETKELGRVNKVDPLGIAHLRIRGMWHIENPIKIFDSVATVDAEDDLTMNALMLKAKYDSFPENDRSALANLTGENLTIKDVKIKSPNNPAQLLDAKLITYAQ